jgi:CRP-like cAMP-binding protein
MDKSRGGMDRTCGRTRRLSIRVSEEELAGIRENAASCGLPVAEYLRRNGTGTQPGRENRRPHLRRRLTGELELLKKFVFLSSLSEEEFCQSVEKIRIEKFARNKTVLSQGDSNLFMFVIIDGGVKVILIDEKGREIILAIQRAGDFFGEMSLIDGKTVSASVVATESSTIAMISKDDFYSLLHNQKKILLSLLQTLCHRIRSSNAIIETMNQASASQRVRMLLLMLCGRHGEPDGREYTLSIPLTHQDIANMTGLTRETVTRVMQELKKSGQLVLQANKRFRLRESFFTCARI